ncbi:MAG: hypothetical protein O2964_04985 [Verrucomicrobia bacterium]|nr:hypothetical protein [Verrucomicrobiota bacterium]
MNSHYYEFDTQWIIKLLGTLIAFMVGGALVLRFAAPILPSSRNTWDMDRTIMAHQADASGRANDADILLIGDSSCLMNIDASIASEHLGKKVLNLGAVSFLDVEMFGNLVKRYLESCSKSPDTIVLVTHPDFLRRSSASRSHVAWMEHYLAGRDDLSRRRNWKSIDQWLGAHILQGRILKYLPRPLSVEFGQQFGFTHDLETYMHQHGGSALDPRTLDAEKLTGSREYRISSPNKKAASLFALTIPDNSRLFIALTPLPESFVNAQFSDNLEAIRKEWATTLSADRELAALPFSMPDELFASKTHLAPAAVEDYTIRFAESLK